MLSPWILAWLMAITSVGAVERQQLALTVETAKTLSVPLTETDLLQQLGPPLAEYPAAKGWGLFRNQDRPRQLCYGANVKLDCVLLPESWLLINPLPIALRFFGYEPDDLVVDVDEQGMVTRLALPEVQYPVDHRYDGILWLYQIGSFCLCFRGSSRI